MRPNLVLKTHIMRVPHHPGSRLLPRSPSSTSNENYHRIHHPRCCTNDAISSGAAVIILLSFKLSYSRDGHVRYQLVVPFSAPALTFSILDYSVSWTLRIVKAFSNPLINIHHQ